MNRRKGFTLTELLIVILIIGILMTMMTTKTTEAVAVSRASNIMANLRTMKRAAIAIFIKSRDTWEEKGVAPVVEDVVDYMIDDANYDGYHIYLKDFEPNKTAAECEWYICYKFPEIAADNESIKIKLAERAVAMGLRAVEVDPEAQGGAFTGVNGAYTSEYRAVGLRVH